MGKLDEFHKYRSYFSHYDVIISHIQNIIILEISGQFTTILHSFTVLNQAERFIELLRIYLSSYLEYIRLIKAQIINKNAFYWEKILNFQ